MDPEVREPRTALVDAFRRVYEENYARLFAYAVRRTESSEDAAEVVAETFLAAWRRFDDVPADEEARLWLYGVARKVLTNQRRGNRRKDRLHAAMRLDRSGPPPDVPADPVPGSYLDQVGQAFAALRQADRDLLGLIAWEDLSYPQIAVVLGCTQGAARIRVHRARRRFAALIDGLPSDENRSSSAKREDRVGMRPIKAKEERC